MLVVTRYDRRTNIEIMTNLYDRRTNTEIMTNLYLPALIQARGENLQIRLQDKVIETKGSKYLISRKKSNLVLRWVPLTVFHSGLINTRNPNRILNTKVIQICTYAILDVNQAAVVSWQLGHTK